MYFWHFYFFYYKDIVSFNALAEIFQMCKYNIDVWITVQFFINIVAVEAFYQRHEKAQNIDVDNEYSKKQIFFC